jgi:hypothetical protein
MAVTVAVKASAVVRIRMAYTCRRRSRWAERDSRRQDSPSSSSCAPLSFGVVASKSAMVFKLLRELMLAEEEAEAAFRDLRKSVD